MGLSEFVERVRALIRAGDVRISEHGYDELAEDGLSVREVLSGVPEAVVVEEYLSYPKGPCVLILADGSNRSGHSCCMGYPKRS